jgi:hypothetical protein
MKTFQSGLATLFTIAFTLAASAQPGGVFKFESADLIYVLESYQSMTGLKLVIASNVHQAKITLQSQGPTSAKEAARMIERALIDQAGVVITPLGDGKVSVTQNDALAREAVRRIVRNESPTIQYEVRGEVSWIGRDGKFVEGGKRTSGFTVCVKGSQWSVTVFPSNWPTRIRFDKEVPMPILSTMTSDGTYGYSFERYDNTQAADRWLSAFPAGKGSTRELYPLWYALASHNYCRSLTNDNILPLEPGQPPMHGVLRTNAIFPHLPASIIGTNSKQTLRWDLTTTSFTNVFGLSLPAEVVVGYTAIFNSQEPWSTVVLKVREVHPRCAMTSFVPDLNNERTVIFDSTYQNGNPPREVQIVTNRWPTAAEVKAAYRK